MFEIEIDTGNDVFADGGAPEEIARILDHVAAKVREGYTVGPLLDSNGNHVGHFELTTED